MDRPDILVFFSDQHHAHYAGYAGHEVVQSPNLDRIAEAGTAFGSAYTACPLCVPGRSACLSGQLPSHTGVFRNAGALPGDQATFLHSLAAEGYETVLCGRMHFKELDQRRGFTRRIMGDVTSPFNGRGIGSELGPPGWFGMGGCLALIGGGNSAVLEYDRAVIRAALRYLGAEHRRPQCIVVGTYGPHFPYVAPPDLYRRYQGLAQVPASWLAETNYRHPLYEDKAQRTRLSEVSGEEEPVGEEVLLAARSAYLGMIDQLDRQIGAVREAWNDHLQRGGREGLFVYFSDHGDTAGEHDIFGKQSFYEGSAGIPLLFEGAGVQEGATVRSAASIMDIGPTLCELTGATPPPAQDGKSLVPCLRSGEDDEGRAVLSEWIQGTDEGPVPGRMIRRGRWKFVTFRGMEEFDLLFDMEEDPEELRDLSGERPEVARDLRRRLSEGWEPERVLKRYREKTAHHRLRTEWGRSVDVPDLPADRWQISERATEWPEIAI